MGGDRAPAEPVRGAVLAAASGVSVLLVGDEAAIRAELARQGALELPGIGIHHAADTIGSAEDGARAVRAKPDASLVVACRLVSTGVAGAVVSAGNTGAMMAAATLILRRIPGVHRPAIAVPLPSERGPVVLIDAGANADCRPEYFPQFALMGRLVSRDILGVAEPRVGLLSIGEEVGKGSELIQEVADLLIGTPGYVGNVEGRDIPKGSVDVVVTDGFTGNVALKLYESAGAMLISELRKAATSSTRAKLGAMLLRPALRVMRRRLDPDEYGGAYLVGVKGLAVIGHGNSSGAAIANAIRLASRGVHEGIVDRLSAGIAS